MSEATYVSFKDCQYTLIVPSAPQSKNIPNQPGQKYNDIALQYNYGTKEQPKVNEFMMEWPEVYSNGGIIRKMTLLLTARVRRATRFKQPCHRQVKLAF